MTAPFKAECPHCFSTFNLKNRASAGKKVKCKNCGEPFVVKLVGETGGDFDDVEDYESEMPALPPARPSRSTSNTSKKKKRGKRGSSIPWKPIVISLVVLAVGVAGWIGYQALPSGGLMTMLDSPESVLDDYYQAQHDWVDAMARVNSNDDLEQLKRDSETYRNRVWGLIERMVLLGPISEERADEVRKYDEELEELHDSGLRERSRAEAERLRSLNLDQRQLFAALDVLEWIPFSKAYAFPTPEPRADHAGDEFQAEFDRINRDFAKLIVRIDDLSDAKSRLDEVDRLVQRIEKLRNRKDRGGEASGSPYEDRRFMWMVLITEWMSDHEELLEQDESVKEAYGTLHFVWRSAETKRDEQITSSGLEALKEERRIEDIQKLAAVMKYAIIVNDAFDGYDVSSRGLSWRVHLVRHYDTSLYFKFDHDQDWTAPQNRNLQNARPDIFQSQYDTDPTRSSFHLIVGPDTAFSPEYGGLHWRNLRDGSSNTIMVVEGGKGTSEVWTKPGGITFTPDNPKKNLGEFDGEFFHVMMFDGSVRRVSKDVDDEVLNAMIRPQDVAKTTRAAQETANDASAQKPANDLNLAEGDHPRLKQLGEAMLKYHEKYQHFPRDSEELSWRVHLLQLLDPELYSQFDLDSSFNSPQNAKLLKKCPEIFKSEYDQDASKSGFNVFFRGPLSKQLPGRRQGITNEESKTIMIIEGGRGTARPWTQPGGVRIGSVPEAVLGKIDGNEYFAVMFDGSVKRIPKRMDATEFLKMATGHKGIRIIQQ